jgi:hypothetical protein
LRLVLSPLAPHIQAKVVAGIFEFMQSRAAMAGVIVIRRPQHSIGLNKVLTGRSSVCVTPKTEEKRRHQ